MIQTAKTLMHKDVEASYLHRRYLPRQLIFGDDVLEILDARGSLGLGPKP